MAKRLVMLNFTAEMWSHKLAIYPPKQIVETKIIK